MVPVMHVLGPFRILKKLCSNAYFLELSPTKMSIIPVFMLNILSHRGAFELPPFPSDDSPGFRCSIWLCHYHVSHQLKK